MCSKINKELENSLVLPCCCHLICVLALETWKKTNPVLHFDVPGKTYVLSVEVWGLGFDAPLSPAWLWASFFRSLWFGLPLQLGSPSLQSTLTSIRWIKLFLLLCRWVGIAALSGTSARKDELRWRENSWRDEVSHFLFPARGDHRLWKWARTSPTQIQTDSVVFAALCRQQNYMELLLIIP